MVNIREIGRYGEAAVKAVELVTSGTTKNPIYAWGESTRDIFGSGTSKSQGCPKGAFLGLCEEGFVKGIPCGDYTRSKENKSYALKAVQLLKTNPDLCYDMGKLWSEVLKLEGKDISHNHQMEVVIALWNNDLIEI